MKDGKNDIPQGGQIEVEIKKIFLAAEETLKKIKRVDDTLFKDAITEMLSQDARHYCTQEFLRQALRQGCAYDFDEMKAPEKEAWLLQCKDPKQVACKYFLQEIVKPTQLRNIMFGKQLRKQEFDGLLKPKLDNPAFPTSVARLFAFDFQARGVYTHDSKPY